MSAEIYGVDGPDINGDGRSDILLKEYGAWRIGKAIYRHDLSEAGRVASVRDAPPIYTLTMYLTWT